MKTSLPRFALFLFLNIFPFFILSGCGKNLLLSENDGNKKVSSVQDQSPHQLINFAIDPSSLPKIERAGLGCDNNQCIWANTTDEKPEFCTVNLYTANEKQPRLLATLTQPMCAKKLVTFEIPFSIRTKYRHIYFNLRKDSMKTNTEAFLIEINSALPAGTISSPPSVRAEITNLGLGCDQNQCIWLNTNDPVPDFCTVKLWTAPSNSTTALHLATLSKTVCLPTIITFEIPVEIRTLYRSIAVTIENSGNSFSSDPKTILINPSLTVNPTPTPIPSPPTPVLTQPQLDCDQNQCIKAPFSGMNCPQKVIFKTPTWIRPSVQGISNITSCTAPTTSSPTGIVLFEVPAFFRERYRTIEFSLVHPTTQQIMATQTMELRPRLFTRNRLGVGFNIPSLFGTYSNKKDIPLLERNIRIEMAKRAIADAYLKGAQHVTILAPGFFPHSGTDVKNQRNDLIDWIEAHKKNDVTLKELYWSRVDELVNEVSKYGLGIIIRGWEDALIFPNLANEYYGRSETVRHFIYNPQSLSYQLYSTYWTELINRYKNTPEFIAVGMPNELSLSADLDLKGRCGTSGAEACKPYELFTTNEMIQFFKNTYRLFKNLAPHLEIVPGTGMARGSAQHIRLHPEIQVDVNGPDWTVDTKEDLTTYIRDVFEPFQLVDFHAYNGNEGGWKPGWLTLNRFDSNCSGVEQSYGNNPTAYKVQYDQCKVSTSFLELIQNLLTHPAQGINKGLYFGELGEGQESGLTADAPFTQKVLDLIRKDNNINASVWALEFFQFNTYTYQDPGENFWGIAIDPVNSLMAPLFNKMIQKREELKDDFRFPNGGYKLAPGIRTLITYPFQGAYLENSQTFINVVATSESGLIQKVELWIDGSLKTTLNQFPFKSGSLNFNPGTHFIEARAFNSLGQVGSHQIKIFTPGTSDIVIIREGIGGCGIDPQTNEEGCGIWVNTVNVKNSAQIRIYSDSTRAELLEALPIGGFESGANGFANITFGVSKSILNKGIYMQIVNDPGTPQEKGSEVLPL